MINDHFPSDVDEIGPTAPPPETNQAWMVTFSDLMSLMLAFFVMLFSMSNLQTQAWKSIVSGLSDELSPGRERAILEIDKDSRPLRVMEPKGIDLGYLEAVIREKFRNHPVLSNARVHSREDRIVIAMPVGLLFQQGDAQPVPGAKAVIEAVGLSLASIKNRVEVHVYSAHIEPDALLANESYGSLWELSLSRALTIRNLFSKSGLELSVIPVGHAIEVTKSGTVDDLIELIIREIGA